MKAILFETRRLIKTAVIVTAILFSIVVFDWLLEDLRVTLAALPDSTQFMVFVYQALHLLLGAIVGGLFFKRI